MDKEKTTEILDLLEDIVVKTCTPSVKHLLEELKYPMPENMESFTKNLIGKIGVRIVFGKELADEVLMRAANKK